MSCTAPSLTVSISPTVGEASSTARDHERSGISHRARRHSYDTFRDRQPSNADAVFVRVDIFLCQLKRRLDRLEKYRQEQLLQFDAQLERGYATLKDVRDSCSATYSELLWGAAKERAQIFVDTLESRYNDVMPTRETLEWKAHAGMKIMEAHLADIESVVQARQHSFSAAFDEGRRRIDHSLTAAQGMLGEGYEQARRAKDILTESVSRALQLAQESRLILYEDLPVPWRVNQYILGGYRFTESKIECVTSIFRPSNETVNIWSHVIGLFIVLAIAFHYYPSSSTFPLSTKWDIFIAACFFTAACKCLICSTVWHTMSGIADHKLHTRFACVDYSGISVLIAASIMSSEWTAFYCEPVPRTIWISITGVLGTLGVILPWRESFNRADMAWARVAFYVSLAISGFIPGVHLYYTRGGAWCFYFYSPLVKSVAVYFTGAIIYALQIPEKWWPGFFDYVGGSHNIWHLAVLGGILFHYSAMMQFFNGAFARAAQGGCSVM